MDNTFHAAFRHAWLQIASAQVLDPAAAAQLPPHTEDDIIGNIHSFSHELATLASQEDTA